MKTISRRKFVKDSIKATTAAAVIMPYVSNAESLESPLSAFQFAQIPLPYSFNALEPHIDAMTMEIHYSKHHTAYIKNVTDAIAAENITVATEKEFFGSISKFSPKARNNGGGAWNHNFFWQ